MEYLFEKLIQEFGKRAIAQIKLPDFIHDNFNNENKFNTTIGQFKFSTKKFC